MLPFQIAQEQVLGHEVLEDYYQTREKKSELLLHNKFLIQYLKDAKDLPGEWHFTIVLF